MSFRKALWHTLFITLSKQHNLKQLPQISSKICLLETEVMQKHFFCISKNESTLISINLHQIMAQVFFGVFSLILRHIRWCVAYACNPNLNWNTNIHVKTVCPHKRHVVVVVVVLFFCSVPLFLIFSKRTSINSIHVNFRRTTKMLQFSLQNTYIFVSY